MMDKEIIQHWKNFTDEIASIFHWRFEEDVNAYISGLEGDVPLEGLDRIYISKEMSRILDKYGIPLHRDLYYTMEAVRHEQLKTESVE